MATKKTPAPKTEEQLLEQPAEETMPKDNSEAKLKAQQAEIERLKAQLAKAQTGRGGQNDAEVVKRASAEAAAAGQGRSLVLAERERPERADPGGRQVLRYQAAVG